MKRRLILFLVVILSLFVKIQVSIAVDDIPVVISSTSEITASRNVPFEIDVQLNQVSQVVGYQFKLNYDYTKFSLDEIIIDSTKEANTVINIDEQGNIYANYSNIGNPLEGDINLFRLIFKPYRVDEGAIYDVISLATDYTQEVTMMNEFYQMSSTRNIQSQFSQVKIGVFGDLSGDGEITILDIGMLQLYLAGLKELSPSELHRVDANQDGNVSLMDVSLMQLYLAGKRTSIGPEMFYYITFETNGSELISPLMYQEGQTIIMPIKPKKTGFVFSGWYEDFELTLPFDETYMPNRDIFLYAKWVEGVAPADGIYDLSDLEGTEKGKLFAAAERYLLENVYAGVPLYTRATRIMYSDRVQLFSPTYNGVMKFGDKFSQLSADDSTVKMYEETYGNPGEYTWRASYNTDPTTLNPWIADDSATSDFIDMFTGGLYNFFFDASKTGYEINPELALSNPIPVNPTEINGKLYAKVWQIPLRDNLTWKFHPNTDTSGLPAGYEELDASDYLWTWKYALDNSWFRAYTGGGDFVSQGIKGVADYLDGIVPWESVGLRMAEGETNVLELEYINEKSMFEIKYSFAGGVLSPVNQELFEALGGEAGYGVSPQTVASSGVYYFDQWNDGLLLTFKKNTLHPQSGMYHYTGYQYRYIDGSDNIFAEFLAGRLDVASVPSSQITNYISDPRVKTAPDSTTWRLMINGFGTEEARDAYIAENPSVGISETFVPEPILSYLPMRQALYYGFDRYYAVIELVKLYLPAHTLFAQTYFLDGESGLSVRSTPEGMAIVDDFGRGNYGYDAAYAQNMFKEAVTAAIADGFYTPGTSTNYNTIELIFTYASSGNTSVQMLAANIEEQYETLLVDDVNYVNIDILINDVAFPNNYYDYMMVANTDLGIGGISGSLLDAPSFLDVFADDNRGGFTFNWGIDTSSVNIPVAYTNLDGVEVFEMWSYNALVEALNGKVYVKDGQEQTAWTDPVDLVDAYLDMSGEVRSSLADGNELASYVVGDLAALATSLNVDSVEAHIVVTVSGKNFLFILTKDGTRYSLHQQLGLDTDAASAIQNYIYNNYGNYELVVATGPLTDAEIEANAYIAGSYGYTSVAEVAADVDAPVAFTEVYATTWDPIDPWDDAVVVLHIGDYYIGWYWL